MTEKERERMLEAWRKDVAALMPKPEKRHWLVDDMSPRKANPRTGKANPRKESPRKANPRKESPRKESPRKANPRKANPRKANPRTGKESPRKANPRTGKVSCSTFLKLVREGARQAINPRTGRMIKLVNSNGKMSATAKKVMEECRK